MRLYDNKFLLYGDIRVNPLKLMFKKICLFHADKVVLRFTDLHQRYRF